MFKILTNFLACSSFYVYMKVLNPPSLSLILHLFSLIIYDNNKKDFKLNSKLNFHYFNSLSMTFEKIEFFYFVWKIYACTHNHKYVHASMQLKEGFNFSLLIIIKKSFYVIWISKKQPTMFRRLHFNIYTWVLH